MSETVAEYKEIDPDINKLIKELAQKINGEHEDCPNCHAYPIFAESIARFVIMGLIPIQELFDYFPHVDIKRS